MTVTLEIEPDILEAARREAEARGLAESEILTDALRRRFAPPLPLPLPENPRGEEEINEMVQKAREIMKNAPVLPPEALTREAMYD